MTLFQNLLVIYAVVAGALFIGFGGIAFAYWADGYRARAILLARLAFAALVWPLTLIAALGYGITALALLALGKGLARA